MKEIKYQVFISSTYSDLINERKQILNVLLMADCIPSGMESFVATDDAQFNVIKKVIDFCDYYILILGKRYGSVNEKTGISYTEMEYDYAVEQGIPALVFVLDDSVEVDADKMETDVIKQGKLAQFKSRAMQNRLASVWKDAAELMGQVAISIMTAKDEIKRPGWHRGESVNQEALLQDFLNLKKENDELKNQLAVLQPSTSSINFDDLFFGKEITLHYTERVFVLYDNTPIKKQEVTAKLSELFKFISLRLTGVKKDSDFIKAVSSFREGYNVSTQDALILKNKFEQLKLIESTVDSNNAEIIKLTPSGIEMMNKLNAD